MRTIASWKIDGFYKADPTLVHNEIESIGETFTCKQIVEKAKDRNTELHKCFEWDNEIAADKYRLQQAGLIIRNLVITRVEEGKEQKTPLRMFVSTGERTGAYKPTKSVVRIQSEYENLLERAYSELRAFKNKYSMLKELDEILSLID